jgi:hypothetical protein
MRKFRQFPVIFASAMMMSGALLQAATITGTVTNKTYGKPSAGDSVVLVDVQAGMSEAATATTDSKGHYSLDSPGGGAFLIRVNHQGGTYFIAAPQGGGSGDVNVYDVAAKVDGVGIDADMLLVEAGGGTLRVQQRYLVRNTSLPPKAQYSSNTFEIELPSDAELDGASATRPGGLATNTRLVPLGQKGHYTYNIPIQPNQGEKETMFEVQYHIPYSGKYTFSPRVLMPADNLVVYAAKGIDFSGATGASFQSTQEDSRVQTFVAKGIHPGQAISFNVSGEGQMPRDAQGPGMGQGSGPGMGDSGNEAGGKPGGGIGVPIGSPDPLTKYKWWILAILTLMLIGGAAFMLRKQSEGLAATAAPAHDDAIEVKPRPPVAHSAAPVHVSTSVAPVAAPVGSAALLSVLKDELFAIESEKLSGTLSASEYAEIKTGLEAVLKRALSRK